MLYNLSRISGIVAIFIAWIFVVAPAILYGIDGRNESITTATKKSKKVLKVVTTGLIVGALFQAIFYYYLMLRHQITLFNLGGLLYLTSNIATILVAIFNHNKAPIAHNIFATYYFIASLLSLVFIGYSLSSTISWLFIFSFFVALLYFVGTGYLINKYRKTNAALEVWAFLLLSIWTVVFTLV